MNAGLINPAAVLGLLTRETGHDRGEKGSFLRLWLRIKARCREEIAYRLALAELRRLDDRDLDDLNLGRGDLPALARRHARGC